MGVVVVLVATVNGSHGPHHSSVAGPVLMPSCQHADLHASNPSSAINVGYMSPLSASFLWEDMRLPF